MSAGYAGGMAPGSTPYGSPLHPERAAACGRKTCRHHAADHLGGADCWLCLGTDEPCGRLMPVDSLGVAKAGPLARALAHIILAGASLIVVTGLVLLVTLAIRSL